MKRLKPRKIGTILILQIFLLASIVYSQPSNRSLFKNKQPNYKVIQDQRESAMEKKREALTGIVKPPKISKNKDDLSKKIDISSLKDISTIHIPENLGKIVEVYQAPSDESPVPATDRTTTDELPLIVHIQDLHTNPEAQLNSASILELLIKDYGMWLVCSEGAEGEVDTSTVSSFPDADVREKTARLFIDSGELTGEEYLSITKYPELPIWGIENKELYFQNIIQFNKIMRYSENAQVFINPVKEALEKLKPEIYSKKLLELDAKYKEYSESKLGTNEYIDFLLTLSPLEKSQGEKEDFKNILLLTETVKLEKGMNQDKVMQESQSLLLDLEAVLRKVPDKGELDTLLGKALLFKNNKISPFSFYSYLDGLASRLLKDQLDEGSGSFPTPHPEDPERSEGDEGSHKILQPFGLQDDLSGINKRKNSPRGQLDKYPVIIQFVGYLKKVNSLDTAKLFHEIDELTYETKDAISTDEKQKILTRALRHIKFMEDFFNLKVSNEELDYYYKDKSAFGVAWFKSEITDLTKETNLTNKTDSSANIDFNPDLIDLRLPELEEFYDTARKREIEMVSNVILEIQRRKPKVVALVAGGFHTRGLTDVLKQKGYSYVVIAPFSSTQIDEENYKLLLSGKRRPISELIDQLSEEKKKEKEKD